MNLRRSAILPLAIAVGLVVLAIAALHAADGYSRSSGMFPLFVGRIFLVLALFETLRTARAVLRPATASGAAPLQARRALAGFAWLAALLLLVWLVGFLLAIPAFLFLFLRLSAGRGTLRCLQITALASGFVYVVFVWLLEYRLYAGVIVAG